MAGRSEQPRAAGTIKPETSNKNPLKNKAATADSCQAARYGQGAAEDGAV